MTPPTPKEVIDGIVKQILAGSTCQRDVDARLGDIIAALDDIGVKAIPGKLKFSADGNHKLVDWTFIYD